MSRLTERSGEERVAYALESIADQLSDSERVSELEGLLHRFITTMVNSQSTNEEWTDLLNDIKEALGIA